MKCPKCDAEILDSIKECPYCHSIIKKEQLNTETNKINENKGIGCLIGVLIVIAIIFLPLIIGTISNSLENSKAKNHEQQLIKEGKVKTSDEVVDEIIETIKKEDESILKGFLSKDFTYYDNNNIEHKYISSFLRDIRILSSNYDIEKRGNSIQDEETYRIYWNTVEQNIKNGIKRGERGYCIQTVTIILKRVTKQDVITYEIEKIILKNS